MVDHTKLGLGLFCVYCFAYLGFIVLNAYWPESMRFTVWGGINLAVVYGVLLILGAILLAVIYLYHTENKERQK